MEKKWWHEKVAYQIYPKSFYDSNGDGIGDIPGIIEKLDYLKALGVDIVWISPCYPSPFADQGYDISDYYNINPVFGTLEDMDRLLAEAKKRDMYILLDLVVNHCSDEHEWFQKACEDPDGKIRQFLLHYRQKRRRTAMQLAQLLRWSCLGNSAGASGQTVSARFPQETTGSELGKSGGS